MPEVTAAGLHPRRAGAPAVLPRLALVLGVLAGLFAMHGLSTGHDHTSVGAPAAVSATAADDRHHGATEHEPGAPASHSMTDLAALCVAVLTGAAVLVLLLLDPLRVPRHRALAPDLPGLPPHSRALLPRRPSDLTVLCVLRT